MDSRADFSRLIQRALCFGTLLILANGVGAFDLGPSGYCLAAQTVDVTPGENLQALVNQYPAGTTFSLAAGTYRLQSVVPKNNDSFVGQPGTVLTGAALLTTFSQSEGYWVAQVAVTGASSYPGQCQAWSAACFYPQDLFFDNVMKYRAPSLSAVGPSSWYLDYNTGDVYMGDDPTGHTVELSLAPYAFAGTATSVNISNLTIEKYACVAGSGAVDSSAGGAYWSVGGNQIEYNHGTGIRTYNGMYIYNNIVNNNGQLGIGGYGIGILLQNNQVYSNNYAGYSYYWEAGGVKFSYSQNVTFRYNYSHDNGGPGFWADVNCQQVVCEENQFSGNREAGVYSELSSNITVANNYVWDDGFNPDGTGIWWGAGILVADSTDVTITGNHVSNCMNGIGGIIADRGNMPNGQPYTLENLDVSNNTIYQNSGLAAGIVLEGSGLSNAVYTTMNNTFNGNTYYLTTPNADYFYWEQGPITLATWSTVFTTN